MKCLFYKATLAAALSLAVFATAFAQHSVPPSGRMFDGETLKYEGKGSKYKLSMAVADLTFSAVATPNSNELVIKSEAISKGSLLKLFRYSFLQQYQSTVDLDAFRILKTTKHDVQKERVRDSEAKFDYAARRVSFIETDPKDAMRPPRRIASEIGDHLYDMISAIYGVRLQQLAVGKKFDFSISDSGLVYKVPLTVTARERQDTVLGKVWCYRVEPDIFGKDRLIERDGKMVIWMTDDARHTPVRAQIKTEWGKFDIRLKSSSVAEVRTK